MSGPPPKPMPGKHTQHSDPRVGPSVKLAYVGQPVWAPWGNVYLRATVAKVAGINVYVVNEKFDYREWHQTAVCFTVIEPKPVTDVKAALEGLVGQTMTLKVEDGKVTAAELTPVREDA